MGWLGQLRLRYTHGPHGTTAHDRHEGPLRVLQRLYPEGPGICHHVVVHPPGGVVAGDELVIDATLDAEAHAVITTPGATKFYRSEGEPAVQRTQARLAEGARLEWLPLESIAYSGCIAENRLRFELSEGSQCIGWDVLALGLPAADRAFEKGSFLQQLELPGVWLERGLIDADDKMLLDGPVGLAGHRVVATMWFMAGGPIEASLRESLLDTARTLCERSGLRATSGTTSAHAAIVVVRVLAPRVEPAMALLVAIRGAWRALAWQLAPNPLRIWRT